MTGRHWRGHRYNWSGRGGRGWRGGPAGHGGRGERGSGEHHNTHERLPRPALTESEATLLSWSRQLPRQPTVNTLGHARLSRFFQTASVLACKGEAGVSHQIVKELATEGGLQRIMELAESHDEALDKQYHLRTFEMLS